MGILDHFTCLLRNLYVGQEAIELDRTTDWFKIGKGVYISRLYIVTLFMQCASCKMPGWMTHRLESRLPGEI